MVGTPRTYIHRYQRRFWYKMLGSRYLLWVTPVSTRICLCGELPVASQRTAHYSDSVLGIQYGTVRTVVAGGRPGDRTNYQFKSDVALK